jgi:ribosomal protein S27E
LLYQRLNNKVIIELAGGGAVTDDNERREAVEVRCPKCGRIQIVYIPAEEIPKCPDDGTQMIIRELLDEGKVL